MLCVSKLNESFSNISIRAIVLQFSWADRIKLTNSTDLYCQVKKLTLVTFLFNRATCKCMDFHIIITTTSFYINLGFACK